MQSLQTVALTAYCLPHATCYLTSLTCQFVFQRKADDVRRRKARQALNLICLHASGTSRVDVDEDSRNQVDVHDVKAFSPSDRQTVSMPVANTVAVVCPFHSLLLLTASEREKLLLKHSP